MILVLWHGVIWYWLSGLLLPKIINLHLMQVILKLHVQIFILTCDTAYLSVYLEQLKKGERYDIYIPIKSQVPDIQGHTPSKTFKIYFWRWFSVTKSGLTFKINHWRILISSFLAKVWFQNISKEIWWAGKFYLNLAKHSEVKLCEGLIRKCYVLISCYLFVIKAT